MTDDNWRLFSRRGEVSAVPLQSVWTWQNETGDTMTAVPGDWRVTDDTGRHWSVAPTEFANSYRHTSGDRWMRTGRMRARPATGGEVISTMEGTVVAPVDGWVVEGISGEQWVVPAEKFRANYRLVDD